ncbi:MAG: tripartite tricarboxylate transporter TctB family protein [Gemmobacter sp.]|uniref:tripartite tricarboxylate transporter TctB family protein n=1 Tax=Gemmobacter sp. TaxID=1898957 RepID=UPI001A5C6EFF|nr:tripartite tricarboxylate transporter TctB family protein [Gemmobacter sp.]MBL8562823.1 tripartite tricarboxylate transporter TctB family protein [Gemmobacter sp.]
MSDRIFAGVLMVVTLIYGYLALFVIRAPFQYDPLGPESWPQLLAGVMILCLIGLFLKPDHTPFDLQRTGALRIGLMLVLLIAYAELFERLGFVISTAIFCTLNARMMGGKWLSSAVFGVCMGVFGYLLCAGLLELNLPEGLLPGF